MRVGRRFYFLGLPQITFAGLRRGRRQCHEGHARQKGAQLPELAVVGPKIVAPLGDAVRLVDHNSREEVRSMELLQDISKILGQGQSFRRDVQQFECRVVDAPLRR